MSDSIQYRNTDLDLKSAHGLTELAEGLEASRVFPLFVERGADGV